MRALYQVSFSNTLLRRVQKQLGEKCENCQVPTDIQGYSILQYPCVCLPMIPAMPPSFALSQSARRQQRQLTLIIEQRLKEEEEAELELQGVGPTGMTLVGADGSSGSLVVGAADTRKQRI